MTNINGMNALIKREGITDWITKGKKTPCYNQE